MNNIIEIWREVKGYEGLYEVSNLGRVKSLERNWKCGKYQQVPKSHKDIILKGGKNTKGYPVLVLFANGKPKTRKVHRLVAEAFVPNPENKPEVNHKFGNKVDNRASELEWATAKENVRHARKNGLTNDNHKKKKVAQIKDGKVIKIWESLIKASKYLDITRNGISNCCCGKTKSCGGFYWKII